MIDITDKTKQDVLKKYNFICQKCSYKDITSKEILVHKIPTSFKDMQYTIDMLTVLCKICAQFAPKNDRYFRSYLNEKIDWKILETFRNAQKTINQKTKEGMNKRLELGMAITRPPKGYKIENGKIVINEQEAEIIKNIFKEYSEKQLSLRKLANKYGLTAPGLKKILQNRIYIGELIINGKTTKIDSIIDKELFEKVI